jgi:UDP:flavonoid glycosyltransferase YjiC (YdhE family)
VVPFGRDQFEVARRVEVARCGTRLPAKKLTVARLSAKVRQAMTMKDGARGVAAGFAATGGIARGADLIEQRVLSNALSCSSFDLRERETEIGAAHSAAVIRHQITA